VIKKPHTQGGYSPTRGLQNTNPQWVVAPVEKETKKNISLIKIFPGTGCFSVQLKGEKLCTNNM